MGGATFDPNAFERDALDVGQLGPDGLIRFDPSRDDELLYWKDKHRGGACTIIGNGESLREIDVGRIGGITIALNRAWLLPRGFTYYCMGDPPQFQAWREKNGDITKLRPLFTTQMGPPHATRFRGLPNRDYRQFNFDLLEGIHLNNTITAYAFQLAIWMGFTTIRLVGIDCYGGHFYGGPPIPEDKFSNQREALGFIAGILRIARPDVKVVNLNMNTKSFAFPRARFESAF